MNQVIVIGVGGIGSPVANMLALALTLKRSRRRLLLVDGGTYTDQTDEHFLGRGFKVDLLARALRQAYPGISVEAINCYVESRASARAISAKALMQDNAVVFLAVDNHKTRKVISDAASHVSNITIISGANDGGHNAIVQVYVRRYGQDLTPPLTAGHPYIANPTDRSPIDLLNAGTDCETRIRSGEQLMGTILVCAANMVAAYLAIEQQESYKTIEPPPFVDLYLNTFNGRTRVETYGAVKTPQVEPDHQI